MYIYISIYIYITIIILIITIIINDILGCFKKKTSEKLLDEESKVVCDRQDDNVLLDHLHCLHGYLTFFGHVILI